MLEPLYYAAMGDVLPTDSMMRQAGFWSRNWLSTNGSTPEYAWWSNIQTDSVNPAYLSVREHGFSLHW